MKLVQYDGVILVEPDGMPIDLTPIEIDLDDAEAQPEQKKPNLITIFPGRGI